MTQGDQSLISHTVRNCAKCNAPAMLNVAQDDNNRFQCSNCAHNIDLWSMKDLAITALFSVALLIWLREDDHLFWALLKIFANPLQELSAMRADGPWAPLWIPLALIAINIILVGFPVMGVSLILHDLYTRIRNPIVKDAAAQAALAGHKFSPTPSSQRLTWVEFYQSLLIAIGFHIIFIIIAWAALNFGNRDAFEDYMRKMLPGMLFGGGVLFAVRRWVVAAIWLLLLPISAFIIANLTGQLS